MAKFLRRVNYNGTNYEIADLAYAVCSTPSATLSKVVDSGNNLDFELLDGIKVVVKFENAVTVQNSTLKVGNTAAKLMKYNGAVLGSDVIKANQVCQFVYSSTEDAWIMVGGTGSGGADLSDVMIIKGSVSPTSGLPAVYEKGATYVVGTAGNITIGSGANAPTINSCEIGDIIICIDSNDTAANASASDWTVIQANVVSHDIYMVKGVDYVTAGKDPSITMGTKATAEGVITKPTGDYSHAEGAGTTASGMYSHAEGAGTIASGDYSHAEGAGATASGMMSHAEGSGTAASGSYSHAEGVGTIASGNYSHAEGSHTTANHKSQHVFGEYNILDSSTATAENRGNYVEIVGNGTDSARSNARTLDWNGNETLAGKLTVGADPTAALEVATKQYVDNSFAANDAMIFKGTIGTGGTVTALPNTHSIGWTYRVITAGTYAGVTCEIGDLIICIADGTAENNAHWTVAQTNLDGAVIGPASSLSGDLAMFDGTTGKLIVDSGYAIGDISLKNHVHGKITSDGKIASSDNVTIANSDRLIISDASDNYILKNSSITFDGSTTSKALTQKGTWETFTNNPGTVTSVRVQATSPVVSSVNTAQSSSLNTTISLADGYGDTKNPYASKTARYVLAAPASAAGAPSFRALTKADISDFPSEMTPSSHTHGNLTNDGKIGSDSDKAIYTGTGGLLQAGVLPVAAGGTGVSTLSDLRDEMTAKLYAYSSTSTSGGSMEFTVFTLNDFSDTGTNPALNQGELITFIENALAAKKTITLYHKFIRYNQRVAQEPIIEIGYLVRRDAYVYDSQTDAEVAINLGTINNDGQYSYYFLFISNPIGEILCIRNIEVVNDSLSWSSYTWEKYALTAANLTTTANAIAYYTNTTGTFGSKASANGALYATSTNGALTFGTLPVAQGGTGLTTSTYKNAVLIGNASTATNAFRTIRTGSGAFYATAQDGAPQFGTLPVAQGGTGTSTAPTAKGIIYANSTSAYASTGAGTSGYLLQSGGANGTPSWINATNEIVPDTIVKRDGSGNISGNVIFGTLQGNASSANKWSTARTLTIGSTGKTVDGEANVSWSLSEIGAAASSHTHGKITNDGKIASTDNVAIANNDRLIISDASDSYILKNASITFDGSTTTKALTQKGTWETFNNYSHPTSAGNIHIPTGGSTGQLLKYGGSSGTAAWSTFTTNTPTAVTPNTVIISTSYDSTTEVLTFNTGASATVTAGTAASFS